MFKFVSSWRQPEKVEEAKNMETMSAFLIKSNEIFKNFLNNSSWLVYLVGGLLILCCIYYYIFDCKRRWDLRRHRANLRIANERQPQRRRPGGTYREHEIFRNAIKTVRQYIEPRRKRDRSMMDLKRTRSGVVYGSYNE